MTEKLPAELERVYHDFLHRDVDGEVFQAIPELAKADRTDFAMSVKLSDSRMLSFGPAHRFTAQSVIKIVSSLIAMTEMGPREYAMKAGTTAATALYNSIENYDAASRTTVNPFVNAGALLTVGQIFANSVEATVERVLEAARELCADPAMTVIDAVAESEYEHSDQNRRILGLMHTSGALVADPEELLWAYCRICAIDVSTDGLAWLGEALARKTLVAVAGIEVTAEDLARFRRLMLTTGMYSESAEYAYHVGIPTKCGISGSMVGVLPGLGGVGIYSPVLNEHGNPTKGIQVMGELAKLFWHVL